jgi:uncharacterized protein
METPDYERARQYVLERLARELPPQYCYHCAAHTSEDVLPALERLAALEQVTDDSDMLLLRTAAIYHDIGFVEVYEGHEEASCRIAAETLPGFGYSPGQIEQICQMIQATKLPQAPGTYLAMLLADADLDVLGREDFLARNKDLFEEYVFVGIGVPLLVWYESQIRFMRQHHYFTQAAIRLRGSGKEQNIEKMQNLASDLSGEKVNR